MFYLLIFFFVIYHQFEKCILHLHSRGSQADLRERSPDYGTLGRKQRFVGFLFVALVNNL
jgi:hypothetical protein